MKLILTAAVDHVGLAGDVVEVKDGYGRNYLLPRGFAMKWTRGAEKQIEGIKRARDAREVRGADHARELREKLEALTVSLPARAGENGKLFGSIKPAELVSAVKAAGGPALDKRAIVMKDAIRATGVHTVGIKLHDAVTAHIKVNVTAA